MKCEHEVNAHPPSVNRFSGIHHPGRALSRRSAARVDSLVFFSIFAVVWSAATRKKNEKGIANTPPLQSSILSRSSHHQAFFCPMNHLSPKDMFRVFFIALLGSLALGAAALAQAPSPAPPTPQQAPVQPGAIPLFRAQLPGGTYEVSVRSIVAVSTHEYVVDGAARVVEVNIDTVGNLLARFYFIEPNTPNAPSGIGSGAADKTQQLLAQAADKTGQDAWRRVVKNYPATTHARTIEYRLQNRETLMRVFEAAEEAFRMQRGGSVRVE
jgi:hypothetical protein